jgi:hypothetical protein
MCLSRWPGQQSACHNLTGHPQVCVPCGFIDGLPRSIMFTGGLYDEGSPLRVASGVRARDQVAHDATKDGLGVTSVFGCAISLTRFALSLISVPARAFETGQFFFASQRVRETSSSTPGTSRQSCPARSV